MYATYNDFSGSTSTGSAQYATFNWFSGSGSSTTYGTSNLFSGANTGDKYGYYNYFSGTAIGDKYGVFTAFGNTDTSTRYASYATMGSGGATKVGYYVTFPTTSTGTNYGVYSSFFGTTGNNYAIYANASTSSTTSFAGYFLGRTYISYRLGIGLTNPSYLLELVTNSAAKPTSSAWTVTSDKRLKKDIRPFTDGLSLLKKINPVWFTYNGKAGMPNDTGVGTIAQELQQIAPYMVKDWEYVSEDGTVKENYLGVDYGAMDFVLINAIKEQQETIESLEDEVETLKNRLETQQREIEQIKSLLNEQ